MVRPASLRLPAASVLLALVLAVAPLVAGLDAGLLHLGPALLLLLPLVLGRYVGEDRIAAIAAARALLRRPRRRAATPVRSTGRRTTVAAIRGGRLLAASLGRRGPPVRALPAR